MQEYTNLGRDSKTLIVHYTAKNPKFETKFTDLLINSSSGYLLRSDETLTMNCSADGNPAVTCTWSCSPTNCGSLPNTCGINNVNVVGSTTITCAVGNGVCGGGTTSITHHITVVAITRVLYMVVDGTTTTASSITRNKTESLSLACGIQNQNEMNTLIVWKKDGFVRSIGSLYIPSVASSDDGLYVCETSDPFGNFSTSV
uniref:Ig-like domain-containing protein n=1 Tax=Ciona intestinalis TaxID=7719 RepID=H2XRW5_CIOIN